MNRSKNRMLTLLAILMIMFLALALYLAYFELVKAPNLRKNPLNMRNWVDESKFGRGKFLDRNGEVLVNTEKNKDGKYVRYAKYPYLYSHTIGYNSVKYGKSGLEKVLNNDLLNLGQDNPIAELRGKVLNPGQGNDIMLTIDHKLQKKAYELLKGSKGAVVCLNPKNGDVYAMVSRPSFSVEDLEENWESLTQNTEGVFVNRAIQGIYPPGSTIKALSSMAIIEAGVDRNYVDTGTITVEGKPYKNASGKVNGKLDLEKALVKSSNVYFVAKSLASGPQVFKDVFDNFAFNKKIPFELDVKTSHSEFQWGMDKNELALESFGQGKMTVSPPHLAMAYGAIANQGNMMRAHIVKKVVSPSGSVVKDNEGELLEKLSSLNAQTVSDYLESCASSYGADRISGIKMCGKTGTAESAKASTHAWFAGFAPAQNPDFVVVVVLEDDGRLGVKAAMPIGAKLVNYWFSLNN